MTPLGILGPFGASFFALNVNFANGKLEKQTR